MSLLEITSFVVHRNISFQHNGSPGPFEFLETPYIYAGFRGGDVKVGWGGSDLRSLSGSGLRLRGFAVAGLGFRV